MSEYPVFRESMNAFRRMVSADAISGKCSQSALEELVFFFQRLDGGEKVFAEKVIGEWLLSEDDGERFDAAFLVGKFSLRSLADSLRVLEQRLSQSSAPGAPYEMIKISALVAKLTAD